MDIIILDSAADVGVLAADVVARHVRRGATLGLATGSTPVGAYRELVRRHREEGLSFAGCRAFLLDEYVGLGPDDPRSYHATIRRLLTSHVDLDDALVVSPNGLEPRRAAEYDDAIAEAGGIDVQLLGVGRDGHIGFNEPGSSLASTTRVTTLHPQTIADNARFFDSADDVPRHAVTQGLATIGRARHLVLLATGEAKAEAVAALAEGPVSASCPASVLQLHPHATVIVDRAAASDLVHADYYRHAHESRPEWMGI
ncbi:glucosamine-6-phosphate deaminase [uncultured Corynebacterium sp.]|uniref:glucosamine-6-phosphate deaminase n=1 Tax=uncultured Corynebacterium sp. TaxID=159447 RepID=UPI0025D6130F|nr:glucosamine-6-phosphate deaminase [uncultured Corynebacterium sp.]